MTEFNNRYLRTWLPAMLILLVVSLVYDVSKATARDGAIPDDLRLESNFQPGPGKSVGSVRLIQGKAVVRHEKEERGHQISKGMRLYNGDTLYTASECHLELSFKDGSNMVLSSGTTIVIDKSIYDPASKSRLSFFQMLSGRARYIVKKLSDYKHSQFNVKTKSSVVGVRGSDFVIEITQQGDKIVITALGNTILEIFDPLNPLQEPVIVTSFQQLVTVLGQALGEPVDITEAEFKKLLEELGLLSTGDDDTGDGGTGQGGYIPHGGTTQPPGGGGYGGPFPFHNFFWPDSPLPPPIFDAGPDNTTNDDPGDKMKPPLILPLPEMPGLPTE